MDIGGRDVTFRWKMSSQRLKLVLAYIKLAWPDARFVVDPHEWAGEPIDVVPSLMFVHMNQDIYEKCRKDGVTEEVEDFMVNLNVQEDAIHFVVGPKEDCASEALMHGIINTLKANWCYP